MPFFNDVGNFFSSASNGIKTFFEKTIPTVASESVHFLSNGLQKTGRNINKGIVQIGNSVERDFSAIGSEASNVVKTVYNDLSKKIDSVIQIPKQAIQAGSRLADTTVVTTGKTLESGLSNLAIPLAIGGIVFMMILINK